MLVGDKTIKFNHVRFHHRDKSYRQIEHRNYPTVYCYRFVRNKPKLDRCVDYSDITVVEKIIIDDILRCIYYTNQITFNSKCFFLGKIRISDSVLSIKMIDKNSFMVDGIIITKHKLVSALIKTHKYIQIVK